MGNYFEDQVIGAVTELGSHHFTAEDIKRFAAKFDPQPFHMDEEAAKNSLFGALCASGWHTAAEFIGHLIRARQKEEAAIRARGETIAMWGPSPGFKNLKWPKPVYAGDEISYYSPIAGQRLSATMPQWGVISFLNEGFNQRDEKAFEFKGVAFVERREKGE